MRKILFFFLLISIIAIGSIYYFVPSELPIVSSTTIAVGKTSANRIMNDKNKLAAALSGYSSEKNESFIFKTDTLIIKAVLYSAIKFNINSKECILNFVNISQDSTVFQWQADFSTGNNPISKLQAYSKARKLKKSMDAILQQLKTFLENKENIYGLKNIDRISTTDTILIATSKAFTYKPQTKDIYELIYRLQNFAASKGAIKSGNPIYHIDIKTNNQYQLMVALPVNKKLDNEGDFKFKRMVPGSFISTEVKGGEYTVTQAQQGLGNYFEDYQKISMAIDFTMLVTDRVKETDTSKWISRIYIPVY